MQKIRLMLSFREEAQKHLNQLDEYPMDDLSFERSFSLDWVIKKRYTAHTLSWSDSSTHF
jgi:hypothetical protein